jgi:spore coat protein U-like protein
VAATAALWMLGGARAEAAGSCDIEVTSVVFGAYNVFDTAPEDSTGTVRYNCNSAAKNIRVSISRGLGGSFSQRRLWRGFEPMAYNLYTNAARTTIWGDGTGGTQVHQSANPPNNKDVTVTIYGRIPAEQDVRAGSYFDVLTVTIDF